MIRPVLVVAATIATMLAVGPGRNAQAQSPSAERVQKLFSLSPADPAAASLVRQALTDADWYVRGVAARLLTRFDKKGAVEALSPLLQDRHWFVREQAIAALGDAGSIKTPADALQPSVEADLYTRARTLGSVTGDAGSSSLSILTASLSDPEPTIRRAAATALGKSKAVQAVDPLIGLLKDDEPSVRKAAARSLGRIGDKRAADRLLTAANGSDDLAYAVAAYRLGNSSFLDRVAAGVGSEYADERQEAVEALLEGKDRRAVPVLLPLTKPGAPRLKSQEESYRYRLLLAAGLEGFEAEDAGLALLPMLRDPADEVRTVAVKSISGRARRSPGKEFVEQSMSALIALLKREASPDVLSAVLEAVKSFDRAQVTEGLLAARERDGKFSPNVLRGLETVGVTTGSQVAGLKETDHTTRMMAIERLGKLGDTAAVPPLIESLVNSANEPGVRVKAAEVLGELGDRRAVEPLLSAAVSNSRDLRVASIVALGRIGDGSTADALFNAAHDDDPQVRSAAIDALSRLGVSVERVSGDLASPNWQVRSSALVSLERLGDRKALPVIVRALKDSDPRVRAEAARALGALADPAATDPLVAALSDTSAEVRINATTSLGRLKSSSAVPVLASLLNDRDPRVSLASAEALARMRDAAATRILVKSLADSDGRVRARAAHVLARVSADTPIDGAAGPLAQALTDSDAVVRYYAVEALTSLGASAVPYLIEILRAPRQADRDRAARVLWRIGAPSIEPLLRLLEDRSATPEMRASAAHALGVIGDRRAIDGLAAMLRDERHFVRQSAAQALGQIGETAVDKILEMSNSNTPAVRESAIEALGYTGSSRGLDRIIEALRDSSTGVRSAAVRALGEAQGERAVGELVRILQDDANPLRTQAAASLARAGRSAVPQLVRLLADSKPSVRQLAAEALGDTGSAEAVPPLLDLIRRDQSGARLEAIQSLGKIGDASAIGTLIELARATSVSVRKKSVAALAQFRDPRVVDALEEALADRDEEVRLAAASGLGEVGDQRVLAKLEKLADGDPSSDVRSAAVQSIERLRAALTQKQEGTQKKP
jgi:HEAT repeat protein